MMRLKFLATAVALAALASAAVAQNVRVRGTVEAVDGPVFTVKSREGDVVKMTLADDLRVIAVVKALLADIKTGSFVGATALPEENGRWRAIEVHIFPESGRGSGEGDRPHDLMPKGTMTNGTVDADELKAGAKIFVSAATRQSDGGLLATRI